MLFIRKIKIMKIFVFFLILSFTSSSVSMSRYEYWFGRLFGSKKPINHETSLGFTSNMNERNKIYYDYFEGLPAELKKLILECLSIKELLKIVTSEVYKEYHNLTAQAYGAAHGHTTIFCRAQLPASDFTFQNDVFHIHNLTRFNLFLTSFNKYIKSVEIDFFTINKKELPQVLDHISNNCSSSLVKFGFRHFRGHHIELIKRISFPNVKELTFFDCHIDVNKKTNDFKRIFPNAHRLSFIFTQFSDQLWIEQNFSNLTYALLRISESHFSTKHFLRLLNNNPTVKSIGLISGTPNLLRAINEYYTNIVELELTGFLEFVNSDEIHMEHIEKISFQGMIEYEIPFTFDHLKDVKWFSASEPEAALFDFIEKHKTTIETLDIVESINADEHLAKMKDFKKLRQFVLKWHSGTYASFTANGIYSFLKANDNLEEFRLIGAGPNLRMDLYNSFNSSGLFGSVYILDPHCKVDGDVYIRIIRLRIL